MACGRVDYQGVTPTVFDCMKKKLEDAGIHVPSGDSGEMSGKGVTADYSWDGKSVLAVTITDKPWYASCGMVTGKIHDFVQECGGD